ncbi:hypothetical protein KKG57_00175, partial [Patescibacteria group bacterium]|nr:hypothetical protein [Patescibacteria group bacterium]
MTQEVTKFGEDALISLAEQLKTITPDQYTPPKSKPPEGGRKVGELSDYERQLYSLLEAANGAHKALHDAVRKDLVVRNVAEATSP